MEKRYRFLFPAARRFAFLILLVLLLAVQQVSAAFQNIKISGAMPPYADVDADTDIAPQVSPDGHFVVFVADVLADNKFQLLSAPSDGSTDSAPLSPPIADITELEFHITPDSSMVVYRNDEDTGGTFELFKAPIDGSVQAKKMSGDLVPGGNVERGFQISPDGQRVVFVADKETDEVYELWVSRIASTAAKKLSGDLVPDGDVKEYFQISPDSSKVVFLADKNVDTVDQLFGVPITGSELPELLSSGMILGGDIRSGFQIAPDSSHVVFRGDKSTNDVDELYSMSLVGAFFVPKKLNGDLAPDGDVSSGFQISPDSSRVVFMADKFFDQVYELFSVEIDDETTLVKLNADLVAGGDVRAFRISPDSSRVVFLADMLVDQADELFTVPLAGGAFARLNRDLVADGDVFFDFQISPDSASVVYRADQAVDQFNELYSVPLADGDVDRINSAPLTGNGISSFKINPDSFRVVFRARKTPGLDELFQGSVTGVAPTKLNGTLVPGGGVPDNNFWFSPDGSRVIYLADQETDEQFELFVTYEEPPQIQFADAGMTVAENGGDVELTVTLSAKVSTQTAVDYAVTGGSATIDDDFVMAAPGTLIFEPGETSKPVALEVKDDLLSDGDETVIVSLSDPQNGKLGTPSILTLTIQDDEDPAILLPVVMRN